MHNKALSAAAVGVNDPDCAPSIVRSNYTARRPGIQARIVTKR